MDGLWAGMGKTCVAGKEARVPHEGGVSASAPLGELFGEGAFVAIGKILEAEVVVDLEHGLVVGGFLQPRGGSLFGAEEADGAATDLVIEGAGGKCKVAIPVEKRILMEGQRG